ncbi:MAG: hypothetical protein WCG21_04160 [Eubacteriales bacterium]
MKNIRIAFALVLVLAVTAISACSSAAADTSVPETTAKTGSASAEATTLPAITGASAAQETKAADTSQSADMVMLSRIEKPLAGMLLVNGQKDYAADTVISNDQAISYLINMASLFYSDRAENIDALGSTTKYISLDETEANQLLNEGFGARYSTAELMTENTEVVYNAHKYYVPLQEGTNLPAINYIDGDPDTNQYAFKITDLGKERTLILKIEPSKSNPIGYLITSYHFKTA